jgi:hypothetical protein
MGADPTVQGELAAEARGKRAGKLALPPEAERTQMAELEQLVGAKKFADATAAADRVMRLELSPVGNSWAAMLATEANCGHKALDRARARFNAVTEPSHISAARAFCEKYIDVAVLRP